MILTKDEILEILENPEMNGNFWVFDDKGFSHQILSEDFSETTLTIVDSLYKKKAIWIRGLEAHPKLIDYCNKINAVNCHAILSPANSTVLDWHKDEWDVCIKMLYGHRIYQVEDDIIKLSAGEELTIVKGKYHKVFCPVDAVTLNYGISRQDGVFSSHEFFMGWKC